MLIDWFTVAAQIVNFLVLVWILKRFLYRRILSAIEAREAKIAERLAAAEAKEKEAGQQLALYQARLQDIEQQRESRLAQARLDAGKLQTEMLEQAREHVCSLEAEWQEDVNREREAFLLELRRRAGAEILAITRRAMADLACMDVQDCAVRVFLEKIRLMNHDSTKILSKGDLVIRTACALSGDIQAEIQQTIEERVKMPVILRFERASGTGCGLELRGNGWRIGWNSESYLEALEEDLREALEHSPEPKSHAAGVA